ncbi:hypothetical protein C3F09_08175 [candidate division GN15 bacterium]|uniref:Fructosamine kinase n=1 Tax=candidate division GN15 bacterium TaxID=2072418 RepID=A0A855X4F7_9BACT|nr:MAG: hypothetical protein C3F09_08175 [candidate division GN15 bacterium]
MADGNNCIPRIRFGPITWLTDSVRARLEEAVSRYKGSAWRIKSEKDLSEFACHRCAIASDDSFAAFFKYNEAPEARRQFEVELDGLRTLADKAGVLTPLPIDIVPVENGMLLVMEALSAIERGHRQWLQMGATLARIHRIKRISHGYETNGYFGPLDQDNKPTPHWETFFRERRLLPMLRTAVNSGNLPSAIADKVESLVVRLPELCGPETRPALLHGDAQQNNFISTALGAFVIDPAVYYGNPEIDLALVDSFQPVPDAFFEGYLEELPIDSGFDERRDLWRIPSYLAAVAIEGAGHLNRLTGALRKYE